MRFALTKVETVRRPTWLARLLIATLLGGLFFGILANLYSFLAPNAPPKEGVMVIEGWIHDFALDEAVKLYRAGNYAKIVCTGVPVETGSYIQQFKSYPEMTADRLRKLGIPKKEIVVAVADETKKDRTFQSAVALRQAIIAYNIKETNLHLVTTGPHGRRSRLLFRKALGSNYDIGITSLEDISYDPDRWYAYSEGVRKVIGETIAYLYAKLFFQP
jgi:uncharacterized SAM-binding protein YcdF (DUF218 family)